MARKTYSIIISIIGLLTISLFVLQLSRFNNQKKIDYVFNQARQQLNLSSEQKISGCKYQNDWFIVKADGQLWLYKNNQIYFADLGKYLTAETKNKWPNISIQPANSPLIDYYYLYENCIW
jgi:hypothetical protein